MKRRGLVWLATLATLGSGVVNLSSLIAPRQAWHHQRLLSEIFPLEFLRISRFLTLLIGFALVISALNIYRRKRRAFYAVLGLCCASVIFHLARGFHYQEAVFSAAMAALLWFSRGIFTVRSRIPDWNSSLARLGVAFLVALGYGVAGFWFLDPREFGLNFTLGDSIHRTLLFLSLVGDPQVAPHTRHAVWFVDSLYLITATAIAYSVFALFRPVIYLFRTHPHEQALASGIVEKHWRSPADFFKTFEDKSFFFSPSRECFIAYRVGASFAVALGDPVGPEREIESTIRDFKAFCNENGWGVGFHQALPDFLHVYKRLGFKKMKIGDEAVVDLTTLTLDGKAMKPTRNAITKLEKSGVQILQFQPPVPDEVIGQLNEVSGEWLQFPGRRERQFTLGRFDPDYVRSTPVVVAADNDGRFLAFVNLVPAGPKAEAIDLMRRRAEAPNGIMDYLFVKVFLLSREQGREKFYLGMAPMSGFQEKENASPQERAVHAFFQQLNFLFSYKGLRAYKAKFASFWEPRYVVYKNVLDLPRLAIALGKVSELEK
jgi:phosphatidylglycerol lysyltransferase